MLEPAHRRRPGAGGRPRRAGLASSSGGREPQLARPRHDRKGHSWTRSHSLNRAAEPIRPPVPVKIVIAGGFGVGKTTAVAAISEITPLTTEAAMTTVSSESTHRPRPGKTTTTVAMDFGSHHDRRRSKLYLFGTPGQDRFGFMWHDLVHRRARRDGDRGHPPPGRLLPGGRLLRDRGPAVRRRGEPVRRRPGTQPRATSGGRWR